MPRILNIRFDLENDILVADEGNGKIHQFNEFQLREARELFRRFDEENFNHDEDEELDAFHNFADRMAENSPEALEVISPYLN